MRVLPDFLDLASLRSLYAGGTFTALNMADEIAARMAASKDPAIFITCVDRDGLRRQVAELMQRAPDPNSLPLWGIPFAVKDNIDVASLPTTAACPAFAYTPSADAFVVARLREAGAIVTGKTNLDQFATGLNGTRSPYGSPRSVFDPDYISGGSSSGSAVAVAAGLASFALGTDTAGSGRVPAALNNLVGIKPTPGRISTTGLVPACRTLDVISIFAGCVADGVAIRRIAEGFDPADPYSRIGPTGSFTDRLRVGVLRPDQREFCGDMATSALYEAMIARLPELGADSVPFDFSSFKETAALLYDGPWVAERLAAIEAFVDAHGDEIDPAVRAIVESARRFSAVDAFRGRYALETLRRRTEATWAECDVLLLPTAPTTYTVEAMVADPIKLNSTLGLYTNFANLLGLSAIAVPAGFRPDGQAFGVTLVGRDSADDAIGPLADALHRASGSGMGGAKASLAGSSLPDIAANDAIELVVVGAHLGGLPLHHQLTERNATFIRTSRTMPDYRLVSLPGTHPPKPGLVREPEYKGPGIEVEVWSLRPSDFATFVAMIPAPLGIGSINLDDSTCVLGFLCEAWAIQGAEDISHHGGWRNFLAAHAAR